MRPRLLDLFCGAGGAAMGYHRAGFEVVGVDHKLQPNWPFVELWITDALDFLTTLDPFHPRFDAIHASPPCQAYSQVTPNHRYDEHPDLIGEVRELLRDTGLPYVIENVVGAPLRNPYMLCGSAWPDLHVLRHRLFECNFPVMTPHCNHFGRPNRYKVYEHGEWYETPWAQVYGSGGGKAREHWPEAMGIDWMTDEEIVEAIPPAYTEHIGGYLLEEVNRIQKGVSVA
jgi:DNA (cytosine-5)-methyltransferase 1